MRVFRKCIFCGKMENWIESHSQVLKDHDVSRKTSGKRVHRRESFKSANFRSEIHGLPNSRKERKMKASGKSGAPAETPGNWQRMFTDSKRIQKYLSDLCSISLQDDDVQDFDTRCDQTFLGTSEMPPENVFEGLYKSKLQGFGQLQPVLAMYKPELNRDQAVPSHPQNEDDGRATNGQTLRTRNFKVGNAKNETGGLVKS